MGEAAVHDTNVRSNNIQVEQCLLFFQTPKVLDKVTPYGQPIRWLPDLCLEVLAGHGDE